MDLGIQKEWIGDIFLTFDEDGDGTIGREEFLRTILPRVRLISITKTFSSLSRLGSMGSGERAKSDDDPNTSPLVSENSERAPGDAANEPELSPKQSALDSEPSPQNKKAPRVAEVNGSDCPIWAI